MKAYPVPLSSNRPKWLQIAAILRTEIEAIVDSGEARLATEAQLGERFSVSLMTVRQALAALQAQGLIERRPKHGTLITARAREPRRIMMLGKVSDVFAQQQSDATRLISANMVAVPEHLTTLFPGQDNVCRLVRARMIDGQPCNFAVNHLRADVFAQIEPAMLGQMPVSQIITVHTGFTIESMEQELSAVLADPVIAQHLQIEPLDPVMVVVGTSVDSDGRVLDTARITYRADMFRFVSQAHESC